MSGLNTEGLADFKAPILPKGKYEFEIRTGRDREGSKADENGEKSQGWEFELVVTGPEDATLSDGNSALGYRSKQSIWFPRESLKREKPQQAAKMTRAAIEWMKAAFGTIPGGDVHGKDFEGTHVLGSGRSKFDSFQKEDVFEVDEVASIAGAAEEQA